MHALIQRHRPSAASVPGARLRDRRDPPTACSRTTRSPGSTPRSRCSTSRREKGPACAPRHADMTRFDLGETFDAVLCVFDSINHLVRFSDWERVFDRARAHLADRGSSSSTSTPSGSSRRSQSRRPWTQWFGDDNLLLIDVRGEGDRSVHLEGPRLRALRRFCLPAPRRGHPRGRFPTRADPGGVRCSGSAACVSSTPSGRDRRRVPERLYFVCEA